MKKIIRISLYVILFLFVCSPLIHGQKSELMNKGFHSDERSFYLLTSGTTCPMKFIPGTGFFCIFQMLQPWPDQMYFSLFGIINYKDGSTKIMNNHTGEVIQKEGPHKVLFFNFYGPVSSFQGYNLTVKGDAMFATIVGGEQ